MAAARPGSAARQLRSRSAGLDARLPSTTTAAPLAPLASSGSACLQQQEPLALPASCASPDRACVRRALPARPVAEAPGAGAAPGAGGRGGRQAASVLHSRRPRLRALRGRQGGVYFLVDENGNKDEKHVLKARRAPRRARSLGSHIFAVLRGLGVVWGRPRQRGAQAQPAAAGRSACMPGGGAAPARRPETDALIRPRPAARGLRRGGLRARAEGSCPNPILPYAAQAKHRYALLVKVRREWEVGRRVNSLLDPAKALPGYMGTGRGVVMANGHFQGARPAMPCIVPYIIPYSSIDTCC